MLSKIEYVGRAGGAAIFRVTWSDGRTTTGPLSSFVSILTEGDLQQMKLVGWMANSDDQR